MDNLNNHNNIEINNTREQTREQVSIEKKMVSYILYISMYFIIGNTVSV